MSARVGLSLKLGMLGGIIWGIFFAAYYSMLPSYLFAAIASSVCFVTIIAFFLSLPLIIQAFKDAARERKEELEEQENE